MIMAGVEDGIIDWMLETSYDDHGQVIQSTAEDGGMTLALETNSLLSV